MKKIWDLRLRLPIDTLTLLSMLSIDNQADGKLEIMNKDSWATHLSHSYLNSLT